MHKIGSRLQAVDCLLRHHLRRANRQEAALNAEYAPRSEADGADALHRDGKRRVDERLLHSLEVVAICESEKKRSECRRRMRVRVFAVGLSASACGGLSADALRVLTAEVAGTWAVKSFLG